MVTKTEAPVTPLTTAAPALNRGSIWLPDAIFFEALQ
jgi:hypothetical protein